LRSDPLHRSFSGHNIGTALAFPITPIGREVPLGTLFYSPIPETKRRHSFCVPPPGRGFCHLCSDFLSGAYKSPPHFLSDDAPSPTKPSRCREAFFPCVRSNLVFELLKLGREFFLPYRRAQIPTFDLPLRPVSMHPSPLFRSPLANTAEIRHHSGEPLVLTQRLPPPSTSAPCRT